MHPNNSIRLLIPRSNISEQIWRQMIENRIALLSEKMFQSLEAIRTLKIRDYFGEHEIWRDNPIIESEDDLTLEMMCIIPQHRAHNDEYLREDQDSRKATGIIQKFWCLTKEKKFIRVETHVKIFQAPYKDRTETRKACTKVVLHNSSLEEACLFSNTTFRDIWYELGNFIERWTSICAGEYEYSKKVLEIISQEKSVVEISIPRYS